MDKITVGEMLDGMQLSSTDLELLPVAPGYESFSNLVRNSNANTVKVIAKIVLDNKVPNANLKLDVTIWGQGKKKI